MLLTTTLANLSTCSDPTQPLEGRCAALLHCFRRVPMTSLTLKVSLQLTRLESSRFSPGIHLWGPYRSNLGSARPRSLLVLATPKTITINMKVDAFESSRLEEHNSQVWFSVGSLVKKLWSSSLNGRSQRTWPYTQVKLSKWSRLISPKMPLKSL